MFNTPFPPYVHFVLLREEDTVGAQLHSCEEALLPYGATVKRRREFRLGRLAARNALAAIDVDAPVLRSVNRSPIWPSGVVGSISRAAGIGIAAVSRYRDVIGVGLDVEDVTRQLDSNAASLIADPTEQCWIGGSSSRLIHLLSAKEAVFKAFAPIFVNPFTMLSIHLTPMCNHFITRLNYQDTLGFSVGMCWKVNCDIRYPLIMSSVVVSHNPMEIL